MGPRGRNPARGARLRLRTAFRNVPAEARDEGTAHIREAGALSFRRRPEALRALPPQPQGCQAPPQSSPAQGHDGSMAGAELRAALEQRLDALGIRTEVVEHPEVRHCRWGSRAEGVDAAAASMGRGRKYLMAQG